MRHLLSAATSILLLSQTLSLTAQAFPSGLGSVGSAAQAQKVAVHTEDFFEDLIGRKISQKEERQIKDLMGQAEEMQLQPQKVSTFGGTEVIPLICGQFKANFSWARGIGGEINPCFDPMSGKSYIMKGTSFSPSPTVSAALQAGVYVGPSHLQKPIVGEYGFVSLSKEVIPFVKVHGQMSASLPCVHEMTGLSKKTWEQTLRDCQFLAFGGLGLNVDGLFKKFKSYFKAPEANTVSVAGAEFTVGVIFSITEFPWYERMKNGSSIREAFTDWQTYTAP